MPTNWWSVILWECTVDGTEAALAQVTVAEPIKFDTNVNVRLGATS
jgi:hypothetical protein